jgi:hypothetical protein
MALFTEEQANECKVLKCEALSKNGVHSCWCICVEDNEGKQYSWMDATTSSTASHNQLKLAIKSHLTGAINKRVPTTTATPKVTLIGVKLA